MKKKFLRKDWRKYSKLGLKRKSKQKYKRAKGIDNKMRLNMKGNLRNISIGFRTKKEGRGFVNGLTIKNIFNLKDLKNIKKNELGLIMHIGKKKRIEIAEYALINKIKLKNLNPEKYLEKIKIEAKNKKEEKLKKIEEKKEKSKKKKIKKDQKVKKAKEEIGKKGKVEGEKDGKEGKEKEEKKERKDQTLNLNNKKMNLKNKKNEFEK